MYAPPNTPPASASRSPPSARASSDASTPVTISTPPRQIAVPIHARRGNRSPRMRPNTPAHTACVHTSALLEATLV